MKFELIFKKTGCIHHFQPGPTHKVHHHHHYQQQQNEQMFHPWKNFLNDHKGRSNLQKNNHKLSNNKEHPLLNLKTSQQKFQHDQNFPMEGMPLKNKY